VLFSTHHFLITFPSLPSFSVVKEIFKTIEEIFHYISDDDKIGNENENEMTRKLACRLIFSLSIGVLSKTEFLDNCDGIPVTFPEKKFISVVFLRTVKATFRFLKIHIEKSCIAQNMSSSDNNILSRIAVEEDRKCRSQGRSQSFSVMEHENDLTSFGYLADSMGDFIVQNSIDLLLEFQRMFAVFLPNLGSAVIGLMDTMSWDEGNNICTGSNGDNNGISNNGNINGADNGNNNGNNSHGNEDQRRDSYKEETHTNLNSKSKNKKSSDDIEKEIFTFLEISIFSAGILRHHSGEEINRKKMNHLNLVENIAEEIRTIGSYTSICQKMVMNNIEKTRNEIITKAFGMKKDTLLKTIIEKMSQAVVQLVVVVRNFSLDINGKTQLLNTKMVGLLCSLLKPFKNFPELVLNSLRVTAKLSLQDNFRAQINSKPAQIKCLIDVLVYEGKYCRNIMNGESEKNILKDNFSDIFGTYSDNRSLKNTKINNQKNSLGNDVDGECDSANESKNGGKSEKYDKSDKSERNEMKNKSRNDRELDRSSGKEEEEEDSESEEEEESWPYWYTWPLVSRVAFTLGNLSTSNSSNR
jgi:hypothetical protein